MMIALLMTMTMMVMVVVVVALKAAGLWCKSCLVEVSDSYSDLQP